MRAYVVRQNLMFVELISKKISYPTFNKSVLHLTTGFGFSLNLSTKKTRKLKSSYNN